MQPPAETGNDSHVFARRKVYLAMAISEQAQRKTNDSTTSKNHQDDGAETLVVGDLSRGYGLGEPQDLFEPGSRSRGGPRN